MDQQVMVETRPIRAVWPGHPNPRGATRDGEGVNFSLFSANADKVELCIFDPSGRHEVQRIELRERTDEIWHSYLPEARPGLLYGYRVHGPYAPERGHRFNPNKLLIEPYAKHIQGQLKWSDAHFGYRVGHPKEDLSFDKHDNAAGMPKCRVIDPAFTCGDDRPPRTPFHDTVIYELHVRGFTLRHPAVPPELRGTYAGLATAPAIDHLLRMGITAVELMPVHTFVDDRHLLERGAKNYWASDTIGQDPALSQVKLIAEPWDVGMGGYQAGNFPPGGNEWNDRYRDTVRGYWKGDENLIGDFARRFTGSSDLYEASGRKPHASVNFVTAHDGFTMQDLVSYNGKHNEANGEDNRDGNDNNRTWNHGTEGPTDDAAINALRAQQ